MKAQPCVVLIGIALTVVLILPFSQASQEKADPGKILGTWKVEVFAGDTTYSLSLVVSETQGELAGKISESMGSFSDVAISDIFYDGEIFRFNFISPTPPDGLSRTVKAEFKVGLDTMDGVISVPELDVTTEAKATRESK